MGQSEAVGLRAELDGENTSAYDRACDRMASWQMS
jgi:hypothetical protein